MPGTNSSAASRRPDVSFDGSRTTIRTFTFVTPRRLVSLRAFNGGGTVTSVTVSCARQPTKTRSIPAGQTAIVNTGFGGICSTVTIGSSNGRDTNVDDLVHDAG